MASFVRLLVPPPRWSSVQLLCTPWISHHVTRSLPASQFTQLRLSSTSSGTSADPPTASNATENRRNLPSDLKSRRKSDENERPRRSDGEIGTEGRGRDGGGVASKYSRHNDENDEGDDGRETGYDPTRVFQAPWKKKFSFRRRDEHWYSEKMFKFIDYGRLDDAVGLLSEMRFHNVQPNTTVFNTLLNGYARKGDIVGATKLYNDLKKCGLKPNERTFSALFSTLGKVPRDAQATMARVESLKEEMNRFSITPNIFLLNSILKAVSRTRDKAKVVEHFEDFKYLDVKPDMVTYTIMITSFADAGAVTDALTFLQEIEKKQIPLDTFLYNAFLQVCVHAKKPEERGLAFKIFKQMKETPHLAPNAVTYTTMLAVAKAGGRAGLAPFLKVMLADLAEKKFELDSFSANGILGSFGPLDDKQAVEDFFEATRKGGLANGYTYNMYVRYIALSLSAELEAMRKKHKYPTRKVMKGVKEAARNRAMKAWDNLILAKIPPSDYLMRQLAWIASEAESPEFAQWITKRIDEHKIEVTIPTLKAILNSYGTNFAYKDSANDILQRLIKLDNRETLGLRAGEVPAAEEKADTQVEGPFVDPEMDLNLNLDFTRVPTKNAQRL